jgi:hypothetical protein
MEIGQVVLGVPIDVFNSEAFRVVFKEALILTMGMNLSASDIHFLCAEKVSTLSEASARRHASRYQHIRSATAEAVLAQSVPKRRALRDPSHDGMNTQFQGGRSGRVLEEISALRALYSISLFINAEGGTEATESAQRIRQSFPTGNLTAIFQALVKQDGVAASVALASVNFTSDATVRLYTDVMGVDTAEDSGSGEGDRGGIKTYVIVSAAAIGLLLLVFAVRFRQKRGKIKKVGAVFVALEDDLVTPGRKDTLSPKLKPRIVPIASPSEPTRMQCQDDFAKVNCRDAMSAKDLSGQEPVLARPWRAAKRDRGVSPARATRSGIECHLNGY